MRFYLPDNYRGSFFWMATLCHLISENKEQLIDIVLDDWNNNLGIEYDMLQTVFPAEIPLTLDPFNPPQRPIATFVAKPHQVVHFIFVAMCVDASFTIQWTEQDITLWLFDGALDIECSDEVGKEIFTFLSAEVGLASAKRNP